MTFSVLYTDINFFFQVAGERYVYKFVCEPEALISLAFPDNQRPSLKAEFERYVNEEDTVPLSHLDEGASYPPEQAATNMGPQSYSKGYMYWCHQHFPMFPIPVYSLLHLLHMPTPSTCI